MFDRCLKRIVGRKSSSTRHPAFCSLREASGCSEPPNLCSTLLRCLSHASKRRLPRAHADASVVARRKVPEGIPHLDEGTDINCARCGLSRPINPRGILGSGRLIQEGSDTGVLREQANTDDRRKICAYSCSGHTPGSHREQSEVVKEGIFAL